MRALLTAALAAALFGCSHSVEYDLEAKDHAPRKINRIVEVKKFKESLSRRENNIVKLDGLTWRTNVIRGYTQEDLAGSVTSMIADHLHHSGLFRQVIYRGADAESQDSHAKEAQLLLTGTISEYTVMGLVNERAEMKKRVGSIFGWTGRGVAALANLDEETQVRVRVELKNVTLKDMRSGKVLWCDTILVHGRYDADFEAAHPRGVYDRADMCLKRAVSEMIKRIARRARI